MDVEIPEPAATGRDLLVRVKAVSVNPVDVKVRAPKTQVETSPRVLGWDVAGVVEAAGPDCVLLRPGDEVYYAGDVTRSGGNAELHLVDERIVGRKPEDAGLRGGGGAAADDDHGMGGAVRPAGPRAGAGRERGQDDLDAGKTILIVNAAGGVGSIATQIAKWAGLTVIGTASRPETVNWAREHGADQTISHREEFAPQLAALGFPTVDCVLCFEQDGRALGGDGGGGRAAGRRLLHRRADAPAGPEPAQEQERRVRVGVHVHALDVPDAGHGGAG